MLNVRLQTFNHFKEHNKPGTIQLLEIIMNLLTVFGLVKLRASVSQLLR